MKCCIDGIGGAFEYVARGTSALCSTVYHIYRYNRPLQALTAGAATLALLPIFSRQLKKFEEDVGAVNIRSDDIIYPLLLINMLLVSPHLLHYFLTKLVNHHSHDEHENNENSHIVKKSLVLYTAEAAAITPYLGFLLPEGYNYAAYSLFAGALGLAAAKSLKDYLSAVQGNMQSVNEGINAEHIPFFQHITKTNFALKSIGSLTPAALMAFMLYGIELNNSQIQNSEGFDQYVAWATAYVLPLVISTFIQNSHIMLGVGESLETNDGSENTPNKVVVNALCTLSTVGRGICYTSFTQEFFEEIGIPTKASLGLAIVFAGIGINVAATLVERKELMTILPKILKSEHKGSCLNITKATLAMLEGIILSSPFIIEQLSVLMKQDIIDPAIIAPLIGIPFVAVEATYAGSVLHKALFGHETIPEEQQRELDALLLGDGIEGYHTNDL